MKEETQDRTTVSKTQNFTASYRSPSNADNRGEGYTQRNVYLEDQVADRRMILRYILSLVM
jgi:hypothetical protein